jgi:hypothetical protein
MDKPINSGIPLHKAIAAGEVSDAEAMHDDGLDPDPRNNLVGPFPGKGSEKAGKNDPKPPA